MDRRHPQNHRTRDRHRKNIGQCVHEFSVSEWTYYRWRKQYVGMKKRDARILKDLEKENTRLKIFLAEKDLDIDMLKEVIEGKY